MLEKILFHVLFILGCIPVYLIIFLSGLGILFIDVFETSSVISLEKILYTIIKFAAPILYLVCWIYFGIRIHKNKPK
ncbi:hypothetical protein IQ10_02427 [Halalkalibacter nanhaiisediminis]|uniref:Uncharacterized protein n=1 Tax=Halalkalibacter nanhaiisediminis TaxID=688079 RepID=A0A562QGI2_9BACI|nr:hypothetical protein IQ10_02427 [Halalkalibacter nanhaiisediminis]